MSYFQCNSDFMVTFHSEKHLCDAILLWLATNTKPSDLLSSTGDAHLEILTEVYDIVGIELNDIIFPIEFCLSSCVSERGLKREGGDHC